MASAAAALRGSLVCLVLLLAVLHVASALAQGDRRAPVAVASASERPILRTLKLSGTVTSERSAQLSVAISGLVIRLQVDAGDRVERGDLLLELDDELARYQLQSADAEAAQARQALADARRRLEEARRLAPQQSIAETAVRDLESEVAEDDAALQQAEATAGYRKGILERHRLSAPFPGVISARYSDIGEWVSPGEAVLDLVATDSLRLDFQVSEDYLAAVDERVRVQFYLAGDPGRRYRGRVLARVPVTDPTARTFLLRVVAEEPVADMLPGMSATAELKLDTRGSGIVVPRDAILRYADGRRVVWIVVSEDGTERARERLVETGLSFDGVVEIRSGLDAGDRVVVEGNEALRNGQEVVLRQAGVL